jgi:hypothetical protein
MVRLAILARCIGLALLWPQGVEGVSVAIVGAWNTTLGIGNITKEAPAGREAPAASPAFEGSCRSAPDQLRLEVTGARGRWKVYVRKGDADWPDSLVLKVRRTSGAGSSIVTVGDGDKEFFSGTGDGSHSIQITLEGASVAIPAGTYTTTLVFTVTEE